MTTDVIATSCRSRVQGHGIADLKARERGTRGRGDVVVGLVVAST